MREEEVVRQRGGESLSDDKLVGVHIAQTISMQLERKLLPPLLF